MQLLTIGIVTIGAWFFWGYPGARSAFLGGLTAFLPNAYFAAKMGLRDEARTAQQILRSFYLGETIKLTLTAVLFFFIFQLPDILFKPLFAGFGSVLAVFWFALLIRGKDV
jgi:ATP synthase protein I